MKVTHIALTAVIASLTTMGVHTLASSPEVRAVADRATDGIYTTIGDVYADLREATEASEAPGAATAPRADQGRRSDMSSDPGTRGAPQRDMWPASPTPGRGDPFAGGRNPCAITVAGASATTSDARAVAALSSFDELHAIGIYEAASTPSHFPREENRGTVPVCVDRPGKAVLLLLGAYDAIRWQVRVSDDTELAGVVLQGHGARDSAITFHGRYRTGERPARLVSAGIRTPYKEVGSRFRTYARLMPARYGVDRLASFDGSYAAPVAGFHVDTVEADNAQLAQDPLAGRTSGHDLITPALAARLENGPPDKSWRFTDDGFYGAGAAPVVAAPPGADISWPKAQAAHDPETNRVFGISSHVYAGIYRGDIDSGKFFQLARMRGPALDGVIWSPEKGTLVITGTSSLGGGDPQVMLVDPDSGQRQIVPLVAKDFLGLTDLYDPGNGRAPDLVPVAIDGDLLVVTDRPDRPSAFLRGDAGGARTWLVDLASREVHLLSYEIDRSAERAMERRAETERMRREREKAQEAAARQIEEMRRQRD